MLNLLTSRGSMVSLGSFPIAICFFLGADYRHGLDRIPSPSLSLSPDLLNWQQPSNSNYLTISIVAVKAVQCLT